MLRSLVVRLEDFFCSASVGLAPRWPFSPFFALRCQTWVRRAFPSVFPRGLDKSKGLSVCIQCGFEEPLDSVSPVCPSCGCEG